MNRPAAETLTASWAGGTQRQYALVLKRWTAYCEEIGVDPKNPTLKEGIDYLQGMFAGGAARNTINTVRSLLSTFVTIGGRPFGEHPMVTRLLKGIGNLKPNAPKYEAVWDPRRLLNYLQGWGPTHLLDVDKLNRRTLCLFLLATGQRLQALGLMRRDDIRWGAEACTIRYSEKMKSNDPARNPLVLTFQAYEVTELCIFGHLANYIDRAELVGATPGVFATTRKPHVQASQETLTRYIRLTLAEAGIDMTQFTPYSCRHATTSAAARRQVPLATIMLAAGWTGEGTFSKFYNRPVQTLGKVTNLIPNIWEGGEDI